MQVPIAVWQDMNTGDARLAGEAEALFLPVGNLQQLCIGKIFAVWKPGLGMKKRHRAFGVCLGYLLQGGESLHWIAAEVFQTACLQQLSNLSFLAGHQIPGKRTAVAVKITLRYHRSTRLGWQQPGLRISSGIRRRASIRSSTRLSR